MKKNFINIVVFVLCLISLIITLRLFWNLGIYVDEYNTSPSVVLGGHFWLSMYWMRLFILFLVTLISGFNLFKEKDD